jgi:DNA-binding protein Fis
MKRKFEFQWTGEPVNFYELVDGLEKYLLDSALEQCQWNKSRASELLKLHRTTIIQKLHRIEKLKACGTAEIPQELANLEF